MTQPKISEAAHKAAEAIANMYRIANITAAGNIMEHHAPDQAAVAEVVQAVIDQGRRPLAVVCKQALTVITHDIPVRKKVAVPGISYLLRKALREAGEL